MTGLRHRIFVAVVAVAVAACSSDPPSATPTISPVPSDPGVVDDTEPVAAPAGSAGPTTGVPGPSTAPTTAPDPGPASSAPATSVPSTAVPSTDARDRPVDCVDTLSRREQAALLVWPALYATSWESTKSVVTGFGLSGVLLMSAGEWSAEDLAERLSDLETSSKFGLLVATDEEGGDVQRLRRYDALPSQYELSLGSSPAEAGAVIARHAEIVRSLGVDVVLGPVVDVLPEDAEPPLQRSRFFAGGPLDVAAFAAAYVEGWKSAGLLPVLKHFPGHGAASGDTHLGAGVTGPLEQLELRDLVPYASLVGAGTAVMVGHLTVPGLTGDEPASRSAAAVEYLRTGLGYGDVLVISDALEMGAVGLSVPEAAVRSIGAGVDVVLFTDTSQTGAVIDSIERAVVDGVLSEADLRSSVRRVLGALAATGGGC